jgi:hypothetical protein
MKGVRVNALFSVLMVLSHKIAGSA